MLRWAPLVVLMGCTGPGGDKDTGSALDEMGWRPPDGPGAYGVGTTDSMLVGQTGVELEVQVWYPTSATSGLTHKYDGYVPSEVLDDPAPDCRDVRPVLAFSHGNQGMRFQSTFLMEQLVSHGFVIVAPDHTGNTFTDHDNSRMPELVFRRPKDIADSVDWLFEMAPLEIDGLEDCLDPDAGYAVSGHSFGGYTATGVGGSSFDMEASVAWCEANGGWLCDRFQAWIAEHPEDGTAEFADPRVWASIPMAPAGYEVLAGGLDDTTAPFLVLGGSRDDATPIDSQVRPIYEGLGSSDKRLGVLKDGGHMIFSIACDLLDMDECNPPYMDVEIGHAEINTAVTAFLQSQLGDPEAASYLPLESELWEWE